VSADWWGLGAGAHSHLNGRRWWNHKHPKSYIDAITSKQPPASETETLTHDEKLIESLMLRIRMRSGIDLSEVDRSQRAVLDSFLERGLFDTQQWQDGRIVLSLKGRLLADQVVRELVS
jgi:oxygen-independent coproporphyrinogen-3 oxidase